MWGFNNFWNAWRGFQTLYEGMHGEVFKDSLNACRGFQTFYEGMVRLSSIFDKLEDAFKHFKKVYSTSTSM